VFIGAIELPGPLGQDANLNGSRDSREVRGPGEENESKALHRRHRSFGEKN
jgi:hypothetical protein